MWGGRFSRRMLPELERFSSSLEVDFEPYPLDIAGSIAHARGLAAAGIIKPAQLKAIERGLRRVKRELDEGTFEFASTDEDIHTAVERRLTELTPAGAALHAGRSRNDQVVTDLRLYCRLASATAVDAIGSLVETLSDAAAKHAEPLLRDAERFRSAYASADELPLGSGALAATTLPLKREVVAKALGFSRLSLNSIDAVADRDFALDLAYSCLSAAIHLSRMGEDVVLWASSEFGFVRLADEIATGSSLMPQKKNPDIAELLRARPGRALGSLSALAMILKGLPLAYDRDLQEDKAALFAAVDDVIEALRAAALLVRHLEFDQKRLAEAAADPALLATDAAEELVRAGVPFRKAHEEVGRQVRAGKLAPPWDAKRSLSRRNLPGAPQPKRVLARAKAAGRQAAALRSWAKVHPPPLSL